MVVVAAMEEELAGFVKEAYREIRRGPYFLRETYLRCGLDMRAGDERAGGKDTAGEASCEQVGLILCVSGVGKVLTAAAVQHCIDSYSPSAVIHTGIAGGLVSLPIGDIIVAEQSLQWDFDARPFVPNRGEIPRSGIREVIADPDLFRAVTALHPKGFRIHTGRIVTGDTVVFRKDNDAYRFLTEELRAAAVDMESAAAGIVAGANGIRFLSLKVISDNADGNKPPLFRSFVRKSSKKCLTLVTAAARELARMETFP